MRRKIALLIALLVLGVAAGCLSTGSGPSTEEATPTVESTPTETVPSTETPTAETPRGDRSVEYVIESGGVPDSIESANVTAQVVFVESDQDFSRDACWRETYYGPYKPTPTPLPGPSDECHRSQAVSIDLTEMDRHTVSATVPDGADAGHGFIVTDVVALYPNGTTVSKVKGASGERAAIVEGRPDDQYTVEFRVEAADESADYDYWFIAERDDSDR